MCVVVNFINNFGFEFKILLFFKYEVYLVIGFGFKLKFMINWFEFYSYVIFIVEDFKWNWELLLN